jgi:TetR/AcrR family transcriptional regulator, cholesterol catabolism regulator
MKDKILMVAEKLFLKLGIRSITMDDIATKIGISKKTIYQYYADKDAIVYAVFKQHLDEECRAILEIEANASNPIEAFFKGVDRLKGQMKDINPSTLNDLRKYHPTSWELFKKYRNSTFLSTIKQNLENGLALELYRADLNIAILSRLHIATFEVSINDDFFPNEDFNSTEVSLAILDHFMHGILTEKGKIIYQQHKINLINATK